MTFGIALALSQVGARLRLATARLLRFYLLTVSQ